MRFGYALKNFADVTAAVTSSRVSAERERWSRERLETFQRERLGELVEHATSRSTFYREHYGSVIARREVRLEKLPPVTKAMMMDHLEGFVTDARLGLDALDRHLEAIGPRDELYLDEYRIMASSGSSGRRGIYVYDRAAWRDFLAGAIRWTRMMRVTPRLPRRRRLAQVAAPDAKHMTSRGAASLSTGLFRPIRLSATQPLDELVSALNRHRPDAMTGYPSVLALLAVEQLEGRLRIAPTVVCTTSEVRTDEMTARMREAWRVEPFNCLGLTETGITATDCSEHAGLHVYEDLCIYEVVDEENRPVPAGQPGHKVLVTNLYNRTQPFIRFEITDLVTMSDEPCACGRTFRRITAMEGRSDDILELPAVRGGTLPVHPIHLRSPLAAMPAVAQYQIVQEADRLEVTLALARGAEPTTIATEVERALGAKLAGLGVAPIALRVRVVSEIEREAGAGKFKLVKKLAPAQRASS